MARTKRIFISDIHLGMRTKKDWFQPRHEKNLVDFLTNVARDPKVKDLVLLGDLFEQWMVPYDVMPPTIGEILEVNSNVVAPGTEVTMSS